MNRGEIVHQGTVEQVMSHVVRVSIRQEAACAACAAANLCRTAESKEKTMDIVCQDAARYRVGQQVTIVGRLGLGLRATLWAYVVPLVLLMAVLITVSQLTGNEGLAALAALLSLVPYSFVLYLLRDRLQRTFQFRLETKGER